MEFVIFVSVINRTTFVQKLVVVQDQFNDFVFSPERQNIIYLYKKNENLEIDQ